MIRVEESTGQALIRHALRAHAWMRLRGVAVDVLFFCPEETEYRRPCHDRVLHCVQVSPDRDMLGQPGGVHLLSGTETEALVKSSEYAKMTDSEKNKAIGKIFSNNRTIQRQCAANPLT